ncbi:MAG: AIR synthase-related protein, partial [Verrucomicrobiota bacterium]|nr:AIR synthase-related protein [Verrucomicrobiota bacterium]
SPTRTYAPIVKQLLEEDRDAIHGMVHCSGGGQTKCLRFGTSVHIIKDNFLPIPPIFTAIQKVSGTSDEEMFRVYNMGHRMEIYCEPERAAQIIAKSKSYGINAQIVGRTEITCKQNGKNHLTIDYNGTNLEYVIEE